MNADVEGMLAGLIADLHLKTGAGWGDDGREGFIAHVRAILAAAGQPTIDRDALLELLSDETGWEWDGEQDEPAPIFGCDTRVPSSRQALEAFADRILTLLTPPTATSGAGSSPAPPVRGVKELDGWLVWSAHTTARLFKDEEHDEARAFAFQVLGTLYKIELAEDHS